MLPKLIIYNSVSIDGAVKDFDVNVPLHYMVASKIGADAFIVGSITAKTGIETFMETVPAEETKDFVKPKIASDDKRPYWVIVDSGGVLQGLMHVNRRSEYTKDVIVLVSKSTPKAYVDYLCERNYDFIVAGENRVDLRLALEDLNGRFGFRSVLTDSGGILASALLEENLVDEVRLLVFPEIVGKEAVTLFRSLSRAVKLKLRSCDVVEKEYVLLVFDVLK